MSTILILVLIGRAGSSDIHTQRFATPEACEVARVQVESLTTNRDRITGFCVAEGEPQ